MKTWSHVLIWALLLALTAGLAMAQSDSEQESDTEPAAEGSETVYTVEDLEKLDANQSSSVYTNKSLGETEEEQAPAEGESYSNEDLNERFGAEGRSQVEQGDSAEATAEEGGADETPADEAEAPESAEEPAMSPEERAKLIAEIDAELERLERRLLAIKNPLLAGTEKPTPDEAGLDNAERLRRTEEKIDELKKAVDELREN